jgi:hypothetical protein
MGYYGFSYRHVRNIQFHEAFQECIKYGNSDAMQEFVDFFYSIDYGGTNSDYDYVKQLLIRVMKCVSTPVAMVPYIINCLRVESTDREGIFRQICSTNEYNLHALPIQVYCVRDLYSRYYESDNFYNFVSQCLISSWQRIYYLYWSFNYSSVKFLHRLHGFIQSDGYLNSAHIVQNWRLFHSNWQNILYENRLYVLRCDRLFNCALESAAELSKTKSTHIPPWVTSDIINAIELDRQEITQYPTVDFIPDYLLQRFYCNLISVYSPPIFTELTKCELALILNDTLTFWHEYSFDKNICECLVVRQRVIALSCALGNVEVLSRIPVQDIPIRPCIVISYVCNQRAILDMLFTISPSLSRVNLNKIMKDTFFAQDFPYMYQYCVAQNFTSRTSNQLFLQSLTL